MLAFDRAIVPEQVLALLHSIADAASFHLGGGAVLSGVHLRHRLSKDVDLFFHELADLRRVVQQLAALAHRSSVDIQLVQDAQTFVRCTMPSLSFAMDLVHEPSDDLAAPVIVEGLATESLLDLRASKLTCILSRTEPRDLVDLWALERAGYRAEDDLADALKKDAGIDPGVIAWLLKDFPVSPLPVLLCELTPLSLLEFRDALARRFGDMAAAGRAP